MTTIKEIQELAKQADDWTKRKVAENLLKDIEQWQIHSADLDKAYRDMHESLTLLVESYPKYPDDIPRSVSDAESIIYWSIIPNYDREADCSKGAKAHAERINEYLDMLVIHGDDREQLWNQMWNERKEVN